jgi:F0F1-type ATP synthase epsilon subunit
MFWETCLIVGGFVAVVAAAIVVINVSAYRRGTLTAEEIEAEKAEIQTFGF